MKGNLKLAAQYLAGIVIAIGAFTVSFPHGPVDAYQLAKFQLTHFKYGGLEVNRNITIKKSFGFGEIGNNIITNLQLSKLKKGETAIVTVVDNRGGQVVVLNLLSNTIRKSPAEVILTVKHFGMSCGTFILDQGDYFMLPNDTVLLFHLGSLMNVDGTSTLIEPGTGNPVIEEIYRDLVAETKQWMPYLSPEDQKRYLEGQDVFVTGQDICNKYDGSNPPILFHYGSTATGGGGCMFKGIKRQ